MRNFLFMMSLVPLFALAQPANDLVGSYRDCERQQVTQLFVPVRNFSAVEYNERYSRLYDSSAITRYPDGNVKTRTNYSRNSGAPGFIYEYPDNAKELVSKIYYVNAFGKAELKYSYTYNAQGMEEALLFDNSGQPERKYVYKYDEKGNQIRMTGYYHDQPDIDYTYEYDASGRKTKELHKGSGDVILFLYDLRGNKAEEIYQSNGSQVEKVLLYAYDEFNNLIETRVVLGGGNLVKDHTTWNAAGQKIITVQYDAQGFTDTKLLYSYDAQNELREQITLRTSMQWLKQFDKNGKQISTVTRSRGNYPQSDPVIKKSDSVVVDSIGRTREEIWPDNRIIYLYDPVCISNVSQAIYMGYNDIAYSKKTFAYDEKCRLISQTEISYHPGRDYGPEKSPDTVQLFYTYNLDGNIIEQKILNGSFLICDLTIRYNRKKIMEATLTDNSSHSRSVFNFNAKAELSSSKIYIDAVLKEDKLFTYQYDEKGNWIKRSCDERADKKKFSVVEREIVY